MNATTFLSDLLILCAAIAASILGTFALAVSVCIICTLAIATLPFLPLAIPTLITGLCLYAVYQYTYPTVPSVVHGPSYENWASSLPFALPMDAQFESDYATYGSDCLNITPTTLTITSEEVDSCIASGVLSPMGTEYPMCSMTYALLSTTGSDDVTYLAPVLPIISEPTMMDNVNTVLSSITLESEEESLALMTRDEMVAYARSLGIKGINSRWTDATIIRKIEERTLLSSSAA